MPSQAVIVKFVNIPKDIGLTRSEKTRVSRSILWFVFAAVVLSGVVTGTSQAVYYSFDIFTSNGQYYDDPAVNMYMDVSNGAGQVDFKFYNVSLIQSSLARIYFDDGSLLGISSITNGPGTSFSEAYPGPGNLPNGETIGFCADRELNSVSGLSRRRPKTA